MRESSTPPGPPPERREEETSGGKEERSNNQHQHQQDSYWEIGCWEYLHSISMRRRACGGRRKNMNYYCGCEYYSIIKISQDLQQPASSISSIQHPASSKCKAQVTSYKDQESRIKMTRINKNKSEYYKNWVPVCMMVSVLVQRDKKTKKLGQLSELCSKAVFANNFLRLVTISFENHFIIQLKTQLSS